jgi:very-short-patch-repair endonuclease
MVICKECKREFETLDSLRRHRVQKHKITSEQTYIDYTLNGVEPKCKCGCGEKTNFLSIEKGFVDYILGHAARINNNWGHNTEALKKSHETQKKMHDEGTLKVWNDGLTIDDKRVRDNIDKVMANPKRGNNISKALSGVPKSDEHVKKIIVGSKLRWVKQEERDKQRFRRLDYFKNRQFNKKSKLEQSFEDILIKLGIGYVNQFPLDGYLFDFYISSKNTLIEVDGDWYHCNPRNNPIPLSIIQKDVTRNDMIKNTLAKTEGYNLIRFWEYDVKNNLNNVINTLKLLL